ncbi:MAG TPA: carbohydrate-binding protein [Pseudobacteroides sp.]|nr:carbohydrate-binding protein [Pseudobacteroides sp.]
MFKKFLLGLVLIIVVMSLSFTLCFGDNPIVQTIYTADPAPMIFDDTCYLYTTHDEDVTVNNFYTMNDWRCYSSKDMVNWTDHGSPLSYKTFSWAQGDAWAPQTIYANGKFYMYVPMTRANAGGARVIGVAVSDSPTGPFKDALGKPLITNNGASDIDPSVFIDDDGQAYLYWGNGTLYGVKLNKDMISYSGSIFQSKPNGFIEGPWFYKRNNLYYMVYAGMGNGNENIQYATSNSPTGPWTHRGTIMGSQNSFTNHPGVIDFKGNSYFFYHTGNLPGGGSYKRSVCVEQFSYKSDGSIPSISMTKDGPEQIGSLNPYIQTEAETICWSSGVKTEVCSEGGMNVCFIENGDYIKVKGVDFGSGAESFEARVASATSGGSIEIRLDSPTGKLVGTCVISGTGGWQTWVTKSCTISGATGKHDLYFKFTGGSGNLFNFNWWKFTGIDPDATPTPTPLPTPTPEPNSAFNQTEAEDFSEMSGIEVEECSEGGQDVGYIENGDYVVYKNINFKNGAESFEARVASATSGGTIEIRLDGTTGPLVGTCKVEGTGGWQTWATVTCDISGASGVHDLYLVFKGGESYLFNINWWKFKASETAPTPTSSPVKSIDINKDGIINMADVIIIAGKFNTVVGDPKYDEACDLNSDGAINMSDVIIIAGKFNTVVKDTNVPIAKASTATLMIMFIGAGTVIKYLKPKK